MYPTIHFIYSTIIYINVKSKMMGQGIYTWPSTARIIRHTHIKLYANYISVKNHPRPVTRHNGTLALTPKKYSDMK